VRTDSTFAGRIALVTGAASGIGSALSAALSARGAHVVMSDIDSAALEAAVARTDGACSAVELDVGDAERFAAVTDQIATAHGRLDILINNAGTAAVGEAQELSLEHWRRVLAVNLDGVIHGVHAAYPRMVACGSGQIVNVASVAGLIPAPLFAPYAASKFAVVGMSLSLRAEARTHGVNVTVVCPGVIETPLLDTQAPAGLAPVASTPDVRAFLTRGLGSPYPAAALAEDVLGAMARNRAVLVSPRRARLAWWASRLLPGAALAYSTHVVRRDQRERTHT
jgi:NAD(P)-dependent dehydrogenase (short-subunit alcohol dehydrogenase family)